MRSGLRSKAVGCASETANGIVPAVRRIAFVPSFLVDLLLVVVRLDDQLDLLDDTLETVEFLQVLCGRRGKQKRLNVLVATLQMSDHAQNQRC